MANEKRLIDANALRNTLYEADAITMNGVAIINQFPTVDAVEVVRCEKCLYRSQYSDENGLYECGGIQTKDGDLVLMVKPDFFCAFGERRGKMDGGNEDA